MAAKNKSSVSEFIMDGWVNILTSIGIKGRDKLTAGEAQWNALTEVDAEHTYAGDDVARNIVDVVPEEALAKGFKLTGLDKDVMQKIQDRMAVLGVNEKFVEAGKLSRMHGGAGIFMVTDISLDKPITDAPLKGLVVFSRWNLNINSMDLEGDIMSPRFEKTNYYTFQNSTVAAAAATRLNEKIHHSRIIAFDGQYLPPRLRQQNQNWGDSILNVCMEAIRNYNLSHSSAALTLQDFSVGVMKMKNLSEMLAADADKDVIKRMQYINLSKSIAKMIVMDADKEDFDHKTRNVTGFKEILEKVEGRLVTASKMPHTKLFGNSPSGMGGTGRHEETNWYDHLESYQNNYLKSKMLYVARYIARTEFNQKDADKLGVEFEPLWALDETEEATVKKTTAEADQIYIQNQVLTPDEVAKSRFGGDKYSTSTQIDETTREKADFTPPDDYNPAPATNPTGGATEAVKAVALNGAQVTALVELVTQVSAGTLPEASAKEIMRLSFGLAPDDIDKIFADVKPNSTPTPTPEGGAV